MHSERRSHDRVEVELRVDERTDGALYFQRATNLSMTGLFLDGTLPHPPGTSVVLDVHVPGERAPVRVTGEVVCERGARLGMGVRFRPLAHPARSAIARCLRRVTGDDLRPIRSN
jgi:uncharacterized protein (TIGR02266 family)